MEITNAKPTLVREFYIGINYTDDFIELLFSFGNVSSCAKPCELHCWSGYTH